MSPAEYRRAVYDHSQITVHSSLYAGTEYRELSEFLERRGFNTLGRPGLDLLQHVTDMFVVYRLKDGKMSHASDLSPLLRGYPIAGTGEECALIFLRGYPDAEWLVGLGAAYSVDPEFLRRHLDFLTPGQEMHRDLKLSLQSSQRTIFQTTLTSVGCDSSVDASGLFSGPDPYEASMQQYYHSLKRARDWNPGDSIVRSFVRYDNKHFEIDQNITILAQATGVNRTRWQGKLYGNI